MNQGGYVHILIIPVIVLAVAALVFLALPERFNPRSTERSGITQDSTAVGSIPSLRYEDQALGCDNVFVYKTNTDKTEEIVIFARKDRLGFSEEEKVFDLASFDSSLENSSLRVLINLGRNFEAVYCNDVPRSGRKITNTWIAKDGDLLVRTRPLKEQALIDRYGLGGYQVDVLLRNVRFHNRDNESESVFLDELRFNDVVVGWLAG